MNTLMNRISTDWKYFVTLLVTLAGVIVPVWIWRADQDARSVHVELISQTALQGDEVNRVSGLKLTIDGKPLVTPYLTIVEISNDGTRPITVSEFESPLEIRVLDEAKIIRAQVTDVHPKDLQPTIATNDNIFRLNPLLINPKDSITIAILTAGKLPIFSLRTRIAGISTVQLDEGVPDQTRRKNRAVVEVVLGTLLFIIYSIAFMTFTKNDTRLSRWNALFITITALVGGVFLILLSGVEYFDFSAWQQMALALMGSGIGIFMSKIDRISATSPP